MVVDLREVSLKGVDLRGVDLRDACIRDAYLSRANLNSADLRGADLDSTDLMDADLCHARLDSANLGRALLVGADLAGANLENADLSRARLAEADLFDARLAGADFSGADLRGAHLRGVRFADTIITDVLADTLAFAQIDARLLIGLGSVRYTRPIAYPQMLTAPYLEEFWRIRDQALSFRENAVMAFMAFLRRLRNEYPAFFDQLGIDMIDMEVRWIQFCGVMEGIAMGGMTPAMSARRNEFFCLILELCGQMERFLREV